MASPWIDVSVTLRTGMVHWPGNPPARISHARNMERGEPCTVSLLEIGLIGLLHGKNRSKRMVKIGQEP